MKKYLVEQDRLKGVVQVTVFALGADLHPASSAPTHAIA
jgi:hypothetical protein